MDGFFACPECGSEVAVAGLAPGRQVRCGFCHRLVEVPYLPRVATDWKRRRFAGWPWVRWAWLGVAAVVILAAMVTGYRVLRRQYRSVQEDAIGKMIASSRANESEGRLDQALVELDAALELIRRADDPARFSLESERLHRVELARREAQGVLDRLVQDHHDPYPLGDWLNLIARSEKDEDLAPTRPRILDGFRRSVRRQSTIELEAASRAFGSGRVLAAMAACDRVAALLPHLETEARVEVRRASQDQVDRLVETHGVTLETPRGEFIAGSHETYRAHLLPVLIKSLEAKGYLPERESSPWKASWRKAIYQMRLQVSEHREGNYLSSQNRLTRIVSHLTLTSGGRVVWETMPSARTTVPMPGLPAYLSSRLAVSPARSDEFERLLYENARGQIDGKFLQALSQMPPCCP